MISAFVVDAERAGAKWRVMCPSSDLMLFMEHPEFLLALFRQFALLHSVWPAAL